jgi:hypothetical protein
MSSPPHIAAWIEGEVLQRSIEGSLRSMKNLRAGLPRENRVA